MKLMMTVALIALIAGQTAALIAVLFLLAQYLIVRHRRNSTYWARLKMTPEELEAFGARLSESRWTVVHVGQTV